MPKKKKSNEVEVAADEEVEEYAHVNMSCEHSHGSLAKGDIPPEWVARAIADVLRDNPYRDMLTDELRVLAKELYRARERLSLVERVLQARSAVW